MAAVLMITTAIACSVADVLAAFGFAATTVVAINAGMQPTYVLDVATPCPPPPPVEEMPYDVNMYRGNQFCISDGKLRGVKSTPCYNLCPGESADKGWLTVFREQNGQNRCVKTCPNTQRQCASIETLVCGECFVTDKIG